MEIRDGSRSVKIEYLRPGEAADWHYYLISAKAPGFRAEFECESWHRWHFESFGEQIQQMRETLSGDAVLESMEQEITIHATIDKLGHVNWEIHLRYPSSAPSTSMRLEIENDQTDLERISAEVNELEKPWRLESECRQ